MALSLSELRPKNEKLLTAFFETFRDTIPYIQRLRIDSRNKFPFVHNIIVYANIFGSLEIQRMCTFMKI